MQNNRSRYVPPSIRETAFNCPHCGALAKQFWFSGHADPLPKDRLPTIIAPEDLKATNFDEIDNDTREKWRELLTRLSKGRPFLDPQRTYVDFLIQNLSVSRCFNCEEIVVWTYGQIIWPRLGGAPLPNADLSDDPRRDYEEASAILDRSPRGAAALLRLCIQKICRELGESGENINDDIAALVRKGLDIRVQKALDVVRVVGNNAVHPGQVDLRDDRETAERLFELVNLIVEIMISQPKHIGAMFDNLPEGARKAIEKRDGEK